LGSVVYKLGHHRPLSYIRRWISKHYPVVIILLLALNTLRWFKGDLIFWAGDLLIPANPLYAFHYNLYAWDIRLGSPNFTLGRQIEAALWAFFSFIGLGIADIQRLMTFFLYLVAGFSTYYLVSSLIAGCKEKKAIGVFSSFLYMYNTFHIVDGVMTILLPFSWAILPLFLGLYINGIREKNLKYAFFLGLTSYILLEQFPNLLWSLIGMILITSYTVFYLLSSKNIRNELLFVIKFVSVSLTITVIVNSWLIVLLSSIEITALINPTVLHLLTHYNFAQLTEILRLLGFWAFYVYGGFYTLGYASNPVVVIASFMLPILAFSAVLIRRESYTIFFALMALLAIFIAKGPNPPFNELFEYFFVNNIKPLIIVLGSNKYWIMLLALNYSVLIGTTFGTILIGVIQHLKETKSMLSLSKIVKSALLVFIVLSTVISSWPLFIEYRLGPSYTIPNYYDEVNAWLNAQYDDFKILVLPLPYTYLSYEWGYIGANPYYRLFTKPMPSFSKVHYFNLSTKKEVALMDELISYMSKLDFNEVYKPRRIISFISGLLNVRYVILDTSVNADQREMDRLIAILNADLGLQKHVEFGKLIVYENRMFTPHIYVAEDLWFSQGIFEDILKNSERKDFIPGKTAIIFQENANASKIKELISTVNRTHVKLMTIMAKNPTYYRVDVESTGPFILVFGEKFDPKWTAYIDGEPVKQHFIVNYYANGWLIDRAGKFTIIIEYWPQRILEITSLASFLVLIVTTLLLWSKYKFSYKYLISKSRS
jgi:hypothetical protein